MTLRKIRLWATSILVACGVLSLAILGYDRSQIMVWVGATDLDIEFHVVDEDSGAPIENAQIQIRTGTNFYRDSEKDVENGIKLWTDTSGVAKRTCVDNRCIGSATRLGITSKRRVYIPWWQLQVSAPGFNNSRRIELINEYLGKIEQIGPAHDKLIVTVPLKKAI